MKYFISIFGLSFNVVINFLKDLPEASQYAINK